MHQERNGYQSEWSTCQAGHKQVAYLERRACGVRLDGIQVSVIFLPYA